MTKSYSKSSNDATTPLKPILQKLDDLILSLKPYTYTNYITYPHSLFSQPGSLNALPIGCPVSQLSGEVKYLSHLPTYYFSSQKWEAGLGEFGLVWGEFCCRERQSTSGVLGLQV